MNDKLLSVLQENARLGRTITYRELKAQLGIAGPTFMPKLFTAMTEIARNDVTARRPQLTAIVVREDSRLPGTGFFSTARKLGIFSGTDEQGYFEREIRRVFDFWKEAPLTRERHAWIVRPFPHRIRRVDEFHAANIVAIGWPKVGDLTGLEDGKIREVLLKAYEYSPAQLAQNQGDVCRFMRIEPLDLVIVPEKGVVSIAEVCGPYQYSKERVDDGYPHQYPVRWIKKHFEVSGLDAESAKRLRGHHTVLQFDPSVAAKLAGVSIAVSASESTTDELLQDFDRTHLYQEFMDRFSVSAMRAMKPDGFYRAGDKSTFCYWLEYQMPGRITGRLNRWVAAKNQFAETQALLLRLFEDGMTPENWFELASKSGIKHWTNVVPTKILSCYFHEQVIPIFKPEHRVELLRRFGVNIDSDDPVELFSLTGRAFLELRDTQFPGWPLHAVMLRLYERFGEELKQDSSSSSDGEAIDVSPMTFWLGTRTRVERGSYERNPQHDLLLKRLCESLGHAGYPTEKISVPGRWAMDAAVPTRDAFFIIEVKSVSSGSMREFYEAVGQLQWYAYHFRNSGKLGNRPIRLVLCSTHKPSPEALQFLEGDQGVSCIWASEGKFAATEKTAKAPLIAKLLAAQQNQVTQ